MPPLAIELQPAGEDDFEAMLAFRLAAMRESLDRLGRFDPQRARERLSRGFQPAWTRRIVLDGELVGFVAVVPHAQGLLLDHLYVHPMAQRRGVGSWVMAQVTAEADARQQAIAVTALKHSDANRFYLRHGFRLQAESDWDMHYLRPAAPSPHSPHDAP